MNQYLTICTTRSTPNARTRINSSRLRKVLMPVGSIVLTKEFTNLLLSVQAILLLGLILHLFLLLLLLLPPLLLLLLLIIMFYYCLTIIKAAHNSTPAATWKRDSLVGCHQVQFPRD